MRTELSKSSFLSLDFITVPLKSPPVKPERYIDIIQIGVFWKNLINEASDSNPCLELRQSGMKYVTYKTFFMLHERSCQA